MLETGSGSSRLGLVGSMLYPAMSAYNIMAAPYNAKYDGTDQKLAIDQALADAGAAGGGVVWVPPGSITTSGGHIVPAGVTVMGAGPGATELQHSGNNICFTAQAASAAELFLSRRFYGFKLSAVGAAAVGANAIGLKISHAYQSEGHDLLIQNYGAGICVQLRNEIVGGNALWTEGVELSHVHCRNSLIAFQFSRDTSNGLTISFAETRLRGCTAVLMIPNAVGIDVKDAGCFIYGGIIEVKFNVSVNSGICVRLPSDAVTHTSIQADAINLYTELNAPATTFTRLSIGQNSLFAGTGEFMGDGAFTDNINAGADGYWFGQRSGEFIVGSAGECAVKSWNLTVNADGNVVIGAASGLRLFGIFHVSFSGPSREHSLVLAVSAIGFDSSHSVTVLSDMPFALNRVFGTPYIQRLNAGGNSPHLVIPFSNRNGGTDVRVHFIGTRVLPFQVSTVALGALGAIEYGYEMHRKQGVSVDRGDANVTLNVDDLLIQRFATALTANRTITLPAVANVPVNRRYRIVRTGLGAFTLDVGGLKTIPAGTAAAVEIMNDGVAFRLTDYAPL